MQGEKSVFIIVYIYHTSASTILHDRWAYSFLQKELYSVDAVLENKEGLDTGASENPLGLLSLWLDLTPKGMQFCPQSVMLEQPLL